MVLPGPGFSSGRLRSRAELRPVSSDEFDELRSKDLLEMIMSTDECCSRNFSCGLRAYSRLVPQTPERFAGQIAGQTAFEGGEVLIP
jgi:hypothetical protein